MISRAVRSGQTVPAAMQLVAHDSEAPLSLEFGLCCDQQNLGIPADVALRKLAQRTALMELQIFVVALLVQSRSGGNLVDLLDNLAGMARKRLRLQAKVRALTGEGRMQAGVLMVLPAVALLALIVVAPDYVQVLLEQPWFLATIGGLQLIGALWVRRIANFEV
jgi:tight adherence protein B